MISVLWNVAISEIEETIISLLRWVLSKMFDMFKTLPPLVLSNSKDDSTSNIVNIFICTFSIVQSLIFCLIWYSHTYCKIFQILCKKHNGLVSDSQQFVQYNFKQKVVLFYTGSSWEWVVAAFVICFTEFPFYAGQKRFIGQVIGLNHWTCVPNHLFTIFTSLFTTFC